MKNTANLKKGISALIAISVLLIVLLTVSVFAVSDSTVAYAAEKRYIFIPYTGDLKSLSSSQNSGFYLNLIGYDYAINLPSTYYLEILAEENSRYKCQYHGLQGYIDKHEDLTVKTMSEAITEYPTFTLTPSDTTVDINYVPYPSADYNFYYLGAQKDSTSNIMVLMQLKSDGTQELKSINMGEFKSFTVPLHPITEQEKNAAIGSGGADGTLDPEGTVSNPALRALLIAGIVIPALILVIMIFIPRKKKDNYDRFVQRRGGSPYDEPKQPYMSGDGRNYGRRADDRYDYPNDRDYYRDGRSYQGRDIPGDRYDGNSGGDYNAPRSNDYYPDDYDRRDRRYR